MHKEYHLVSLLLFGLRYLQLKLTGKTYPYWMDELRQGKVCPRMLRWLQQMDLWLLARFSNLRRYCWLTVITAEK